MRQYATSLKSLRRNWMKSGISWQPAAPLTPLTEADFDRLRAEVCNITIHYRDSPFFPRFVADLTRELQLQSKSSSYPLDGVKLVHAGFFTLSTLWTQSRCNI